MDSRIPAVTNEKPRFRHFADSAAFCFKAQLITPKPLLIGKMFARNSLKFIEANNGRLTRPLDDDRG